MLIPRACDIGCEESPKDGIQRDGAIKPGWIDVLSDSIKLVPKI